MKIGKLKYERITDALRAYENTAQDRAFIRTAGRK
jgi:hypothetical protein